MQGVDSGLDRLKSRYPLLKQDDEVPSTMCPAGEVGVDSGPASAPREAARD